MQFAADLSVFDLELPDWTLETVSLLSTTTRAAAAEGPQLPVLRIDAIKVSSSLAGHESQVPTPKFKRRGSEGFMMELFAQTCRNHIVTGLYFGRKMFFLVN